MSQFYPPVIGGEERHVRNLAQYLRQSHDVVVITQGPADGAHEQNGVRIRTIRPATANLPFLYSEADRAYAPPLPDPRLSLVLRRVLREERPDLVHAHNWIVNSVTPLRKSTGVPLVLTLHDYSHACATKRYMRDDKEVCAGPAVKACLRCCGVHYGAAVGSATYSANLVGQRLRRTAVDRIITVSSAVARFNRLDDVGVPHQVIPNFIPDALLEKVESPPPDGFGSGEYIFFVGDLSRDKGVDVLVDAYRRLAQPRLRLLLVGRRTASTPTGLPPGATIAEAWDHPMVMRGLAHAAFVVAPSVWPDPCPTVVLEAMASGRALVTTPLGGIPDMVRDDVEGLLVPPGDSLRLAQAMEALSKDAGRREALGAAGRARAAEFTASAVLPRVERVYRELLDVD